MFETIAGLPLHPLVVHAVVVLGPLAALLLAAYSLVPRWRRGLRWPTLALGAIAGVSAWVAEQSGEFLEHTLEASGGLPPGFEEHAEAGELAAVSTWVMLGVAVVTILVLMPAGRDHRFGVAGKVLGVVASVAVLAFVGYAVTMAGHSGATAVWSGTVG